MRAWEITYYERSRRKKLKLSWRSILAWSFAALAFLLFDMVIIKMIGL
jgi:hypothetical protein